MRAPLVFFFGLELGLGGCRLFVWVVFVPQVPPGSETAKLKVKISLNLHGLVAVESVQAIEEIEEPEVGGREQGRGQG